MWDNYTGPFWSNGKFQSSVPFGDVAPIDEVDVQSRLHDTAYAVFSDAAHREAADWIYKHNVALINGGKARLVGDAPFFFNSLETFEEFLLITPLAIPTLIGHYLERGNRASQIQSGALQQEIKDVLALYETDPVKMQWYDKVIPAAEIYARKREAESTAVETVKTALSLLSNVPEPVAALNGGQSGSLAGSEMTPTPIQPTLAPTTMSTIKAMLGDDSTEVSYQPGVNGPIDPVLMFNPYWRNRKRKRRNKHASNQE